MIQLLCSAVLVLGALAGAAGAATLTTTGVDSTRGRSLWMSEDGQDVQAYFAGVILIEVHEGSAVYQRDSLCVDLFTPIFIGSQYNTALLRPDQVPGVDLLRVSWLVDNALLPVQDLSYSSALPSNQWVTTAEQGAAIQFAIWDIVHDNGDGFAAGRVRAASNGQTNASVLTWANTYRNASAGQSSNLAFVYENTGVSNGVPAQRLIGPMFADGGPAPVPEPSTLVLAAAGLVAVVVGRRRPRAM